MVVVEAEEAEAEAEAAPAVAVAVGSAVIVAGRPLVVSSCRSGMATVSDTLRELREGDGSVTT